MKSFLKILGIATKIMTFVVVTIVAVVSLGTAYVIFAPDTMPKPFRLLYDYTTPTAMPEAAVVTPTPEAHVYKPGEGIMVNMSTKIINLADPNGRKYIRVTMVLEFAPDNPDYIKMTTEEKTAYVTDFQSRVTAMMPVLDDTVITLLSTKTFDELYTAEGKEKLRQEILQSMTGKLNNLTLLSVYFTEFVVQ